MTLRVPRVKCLSCKQPPKNWSHPTPVRGLCPPCYKHHRLAGTLDQFPRVLKRRSEVAEDWEFLQGQGYTYRQAADRLGMSYDAFCTAIARARRDQAKERAA